MFQFPAFASQLTSGWPCFTWPGCPIRKSPDKRLFAPTRSLSQLITSFFASESQGIHRTPLVTFFYLWLSVKVINLNIRVAGALYYSKKNTFSRCFLLALFQYVNELFIAYHVSLPNFWRFLIRGWSLCMFDNRPVSLSNLPLLPGMITIVFLWTVGKSFSFSLFSPSLNFSKSLSLLTSYFLLLTFTLSCGE